jgi:hypothetical protein
MAQQHKIGQHRTKVAQDGNTTVVTYHTTQIVTVVHDGSNESTVVLDSDGWRSSTTKTRMNQTAIQFGLDYRVYQRNSRWFVDVGRPSTASIPFVDGMKFHTTQERGRT